MRRRNGLTRLEVVIIIIVSLFLVAVFMPPLGTVSPIAHRVVCGTNLKSLGTAFGIYGNDYDGRYPQLPGSGPWSKKLGFEFDLPKPDFQEGCAQSNVDRTITASWFLLVREADTSPKSFACGDDKNISYYDGKTPKQLDLVELWDFGSEPHKHVSYAMHNPYGAHPASERRPKHFVVAADMSPWFHVGDFVKPDTNNKDRQKNLTLLPPYFSNPSITRDQIQLSNALAHGREGQNVAYADGHSEYVKTPDVGVNHDNIYTYWSTPTNPTESDIRIGANPTSRSKENDAQSPDDSFLAI